MKRYIITLFALLFSALLFAQGNYTLQISGNFYEEESQIPLGNRTVFVSIPRVGTFQGYYAELQTNKDGFLLAAVTMPKDVLEGTVTIETEDCNGSFLSFDQIFSPEEHFVHFSVPVCDESILFCQADFTYQSKITDYSETFSYFFTDQSLGDGDLFFWDFGDGTTSEQKNVSHTFPHAGSYSVSHSIANSDGSCSDTTFQIMNIDSVLNHECEIYFEAVYFSGLTAGFQAYTNSPYPTIFEWNFGDGTLGMGDFVIHTFPEEGDYSVSLTGEDSHFCTDDFEMEVAVSDTLEPCEAWFAIAPDTTNPFHFSFYDMSNGEIAFWHWDFGDGNVSEEQNPSYGYSYNGNYNVTLMVEDTANQCTSSVTRSVEVDYQPDCTADFGFVLDSLSPRRNHYHFDNTSTIQFPGEITWNFGDGEQVINWETSHVFDVGGSYDVCLNIQDQFGLCDETICKTVETPVYRNIGGYLFNGDFPINNPAHEGDTARAYLYRKLNSGLHLIDTMDFHEYGYYYFTWLLQGEYMIKANLKDESVHHDSFFPVYYPSSLQWQDAEYLTIQSSDIFDCNTALISMENMNSGVGNISGRIFFHNSGTRSYDPVNILLYNDEDNALIYSATDAFGFFSFENIPLGCYSIIAESTGDFSLPADVCLDSTAPSSEDVVIEIFNTDITGVEEELNEEYKKIFLYPVPAQATLNISFESTIHNRAIINVLNYSGQVVYEEEYTTQRGLNRHVIPVENLSSGIYVLKITTPANGEAFVSKFLRD